MRSLLSYYTTKEYRKENYSYEREITHEKERDMTQNKPKDKNNYVSSSKEVKAKQVQYFKCIEKGHYSSKRPQKQNLILKEQDTKMIETLPSSSKEKKVMSYEENIQPYIKELLVVQRILQNRSLEIDQPQ